jgi:hypothetical protein
MLAPQWTFISSCQLAPRALLARVRILDLDQASAQRRLEKEERIRVTT